MIHVCAMVLGAMVVQADIDGAAWLSAFETDPQLELARKGMEAPLHMDDKERRKHQQRQKKVVAEKERRHRAWESAARALIKEIERSRNVNVQDKNGLTLLMCAVALERETVIDDLLAEPSLDLGLEEKKGRTALEVEFDEGGGILRRLLSVRFIQCLTDGDEAGAMKLLDVGVKPDGVWDNEPVMVQAVLRDRMDLFNKLMVMGGNCRVLTSDGRTLAEVAVRKRNVAVMETLLAMGVDIWKPFRNNTPVLSYMLRTSHGEGVISYMKHCGEQQACEALFGVSPMCMAVRLGEPEFVEQLYKSGALDKDEDAHGNTPLLEAARRGSPEVYRLLVSLGEDPALSNSAGETVLMHAARSGSAALVQALLTELPPEVQQQKDKRGRTAVDYAREISADTIVQLLEGAGVVAGK